MSSTPGIAFSLLTQPDAASWYAKSLASTSSPGVPEGATILSALPELDALALDLNPVITEADIVAYYDCDKWGYPTHCLRLRPECIARLPTDPPDEGTPFVVSVAGERLFLGVFLLERSRVANTVPTILLNVHRASADRLYDWYWLNLNHPHRLAPGDDPRSLPAYRDAIHQLGLYQPLESDAWRKPLSPRGLVADGSSGVVVRIAEGYALDKLRDGRGRFFPSIQGEAVLVDDADKRPAAQVELDEHFACRLPLPPGVYVIDVAIQWLSRAGPPRISPTVREVRRGEWSEVWLAE